MPSVNNPEATEPPVLPTIDGNGFCRAGLLIVQTPVGTYYMVFSTD